MLAVTFSGCSESPPESGTVPFKATQSPAIEGFGKQMAENVKAGKNGKKTDATAKPATTDSKPAATKPEPDTKAEKKG
jgi:hypothetical protein